MSSLDPSPKRDAFKALVGPELATRIRKDPLLANPSKPNEIGLAVLERYYFFKKMAKNAAKAASTEERTADSILNRLGIHAENRNQLKESRTFLMLQPTADFIKSFVKDFTSYDTFEVDDVYVATLKTKLNTYRGNACATRTLALTSAFCLYAAAQLRQRSEGMHPTANDPEDDPDLDIPDGFVH